MKAKKEEKFIVIKKADLDDFFGEFTKGIFTSYEEKELIDKITWKEVMEAIANNNKYIVCNQDESYADDVWDVILKGEDEKNK